MLRASSSLLDLTLNIWFICWEVEQALSGKCRIFKKEKGRVEGEHLYNALGKTEAGRYLSVFFIRKLDNRALIVTARDMNNNERRRYANR